MTNPPSLRALRLVEKQPEVVDLYAKWRAEISSRDWKAVHVAGDRSSPIHIDAPNHRRRWL